MSRQKTILINTLSNVGMQALSAGIPFILLPYLLHYWGKETYGVLILAYYIFTFVYFLNGAIHMTLTKYVSELYELKDYHRLNVIINDFWLVAFLNNFAVSSILILVGVFGLGWLNVEPAMLSTARGVFLTLGVLGIIGGMVNFIDGIMYGLQRIHQNNLFRATEAIVNAIIAILTIHFHQTLPVYVLLISLTPILTRTFQLFSLKRILPGFELNPVKYFDFKELKRLSLFSSYQIANQVSDILMYNTDKIIIQRLLGLPSLVMYEIGNKPNLLFQNFISLPLSAILPACSAAYARGDKVFLNKMLITGTRIYSICVIPVVFAFILIMEPFLNLWVGPEYINAAPVAQTFLWSLIIASPFKVFSHMMLGKGRVLELGAGKFLYAIINVPLSLFMIWKFGIIGGVVVTLGFWLFVYIPTNFFLMKSEGISVSSFIKKIFPFVWLLLLQTILTTFLMRYWPITSLVKLILISCIGVLPVFILFFFLVLKPDERSFIQNIGKKKV